MKATELVIISKDNLNQVFNSLGYEGQIASIPLENFLEKTIDDTRNSLVATYIGNNDLIDSHAFNVLRSTILKRDIILE